MIMIHVDEKCYFEWTDTDSLMLLILSDAAQSDVVFFNSYQVCKRQDFIGPVSD